MKSQLVQLCKERFFPLGQLPADATYPTNVRGDCFDACVDGYEAASAAVTRNVGAVD